MPGGTELDGQLVQSVSIAGPLVMPARRVPRLDL
jgi:hypothetical protein